MNEACVDLIYLDPPFNSNRTYSAPVGSQAAGASFKDAWTMDELDERWMGEIAEKNPALYKVVDAAEDAHGKGMKAYLCFMSVRLLEMQRVMKDTGSIYLHVDPTASHYLKACMDCIFGKDNFRNEVVWSYEKWTNTSAHHQRNHDVILFYAAGREASFNKQHGGLTDRQRQLMKTGYNTGSSSGTPIVRIYDRDNPNVQSKLPQWKREGRRIYDVDPPQGKAISDVWRVPILNGQAKERCGYPTQKPLTLLERIVASSSNEGDVVLDPFAGCATACVAAEKLGRKWVGIDISDKAAELVVERLERELDQDLLKTLGGKSPKVHHVTKFAGKANASRRVPRQRAYNHPDIKRHLFGQQEGACNCCGGKPDFKDF